MPLPNVFANVSVLPTPDLDENFNALGALVNIPCTATGTNTIALTTVTTDVPAVTAYTNSVPIFSFIAVASANGAVTININGIGAKNLYKSNGLIAAGQNDIVVNGLYQISYNSTLNSGAGGFVLNNPSTVTTAPTVTKKTSGSGTYTPPSGLVRIRVRMIGAGGGGGAQVVNAPATNGGDTTFENWQAKGGSLGVAGGASAGGNNGGGVTPGTDGTGTLIVRVPGSGGASAINGATAQPSWGGMAGVMGSETVRSLSATTGQAGGTNTGSGGSGGGTTGTAFGQGGGGGEYAEFYMTAAQVGAGVSYSVGAAGTGGTAGTIAGGNGGSGLLVIEEFYQ